MIGKNEIRQFSLLGAPVAATNMQSAIDTVCSWIERGDKGRMVTFSTVHILVEGLKDPGFLKLLQKSDLNCPDGMPLVWYGKHKAGSHVERVCGPEFLPTFSAATAHLNLRHYFYGGAEGVAAKAAEELKRANPGMQIAGVYSPPFRALTTEEKDSLIHSINAAKPDLIWVCLGCPKQELWIEEFREKLDCPVFLAIGLAVEISAGTKQRAPYIMRNFGFEWLYRLCQEPRRLWRRYLVYNSIFVYRLLTEKFQPLGRSDTKA